MLAGELNERSVESLGLFVLASGAAGLIGAPIWGRLADVSSRRVMIGAACIAGGTGIRTA